MRGDGRTPVPARGRRRGRWRSVPTAVAVRRAVTEADANCGRALDDVVIGRDVTLLVEDEPGAERADWVFGRREGRRRDALRHGVRDHDHSGASFL